MPPFQIDYEPRRREWILREHPTTTADMRYRERDHAIGYATCRLIDGGEVHINDGQKCAGSDGGTGGMPPRVCRVNGDE